MKSDKIEQMNKNKEMLNFDEAKEKYYNGGYIGEAKEYIKELEQQNKELTEIVGAYVKILRSQSTFDFNNEHDIAEGERIEKLLKEYKG